MTTLRCDANPLPARTGTAARGGPLRRGAAWSLFACAIIGLSGVGPRAVSAQTSPRADQLTRTLARGEEQLARNQRRAAERTFARALTLDPASVAGVTGLLRALLPPIEAQTAEASAQQARGAARVLAALDAFPELPRREELQLVEATALVALGRQREALTILARPPRIPTAALLPVLDALALLAAERSDLACAEDALRLVMELDPSAVRAMRLADVHLARGEAPRAVPLLFAALRFEGQSVPLHLALARAQLTAGDARGADATLDRVITRCPRQCGLLRARVALESGQLAQAAELARGLLTLAPDAAEAAAAGEAGVPEHRAEAGYLLGLALAREGRRDDAREALEDALERDPQHRGARQALRAIAPAQPQP